MTKKVVALLMLLLLSFNGLAQKIDLAKELEAMVEAERSFARKSTEKGVRDSFLAFIADDGILYRPNPVNGKEWFKDKPSRPGLLTWQPVYADISTAGDMGMTTGPSEFRPNGPEDTPVGYGQFATIWRKQPDGTWKFAIDIGIEHAKPAVPALPWKLPANFKRKNVAAKTNVTAAQSALLALDHAYSKASVAKGAGKAFLDYAADDIHFLRNGSFPIIGRRDAAIAIAAKPGTLSWQPAKAEVSSSGDLGYTYGTFDFKGSGADSSNESGGYMRIWKKQSDGKWKVLLDIVNEAPKPASN